MHYLVTGATGFIGQHLVRMLIEGGHTVTALVRPTSKKQALEAMGARFAQGDVTSGEGLEPALEGIDCVLHLAGVTKARTLEELHQCNAEGTRKLVSAMARRTPTARLVLCSSLAAAGPSEPNRPKREDELPTPISRYGRSKLGGELALRELAERVPSVIVRPPMVYGPGDHELLPSVFPMARFGLVLKSGFGEKQYSIIHVEDLCRAIIAAAERGQTVRPDDPGSGLYYVEDGKAHTWEEICQVLAKALGKRRLQVIPVPVSLSYAVGVGATLRSRIQGTVATINVDKVRELTAPGWTCTAERARNELGFAPAYSLEEGFAHAVAWYRQEGWI